MSRIKSLLLQLQLMFLMRSKQVEVSCRNEANNYFQVEVPIDLLRIEGNEADIYFGSLPTCKVGSKKLVVCGKPKRILSCFENFFNSGVR